MKQERAWVRLAPNLEPVQVVILARKQTSYVVQLKSGMKVTIPPEQLVRIIKAPTVPTKKIQYPKHLQPTQQQASLDLHGMSVIEAKIAIDAFLRQQKNQQAVEIVFGKGTGTLKQALIPYVKKHRHVEQVYVNHLRAAFELTVKKS